MSGIVEGLATEGILAGAKTFWRTFRIQIRITSPTVGQTRTDPKPLGGSNVSYPVRGTLRPARPLPANLRIWLLTQDDRSRREGQRRAGRRNDVWRWGTESSSAAFSETKRTPPAPRDRALFSSACERASTDRCPAAGKAASRGRGARYRIDT